MYRFLTGFCLLFLFSKMRNVLFVVGVMTLFWYNTFSRLVFQKLENVLLYSVICDFLLGNIFSGVYVCNGVEFSQVCRPAELCYRVFVLALPTAMPCGAVGM